MKKYIKNTVELLILNLIKHGCILAPIFLRVGNQNWMIDRGLT